MICSASITQNSFVATVNCVPSTDWLIRLNCTDRPVGTHICFMRYKSAPQCFENMSKCREARARGDSSGYNRWLCAGVTQASHHRSSSEIRRCVRSVRGRCFHAGVTMQTPCTSRNNYNVKSSVIADEHH